MPKCFVPFFARAAFSDLQVGFFFRNCIERPGNDPVVPEVKRNPHMLLLHTYNAKGFVLCFIQK